MKKINLLIITLVYLTANFISQTVFQSNLSSWSNGVPTDWMGSKSSISGTDVHELTNGAVFGSSYASLINTTNSHKRFTTQPVQVLPDSSYKIEIWVAAQQGEIRTSYYDLDDPSSGPYGNGYGQYNSYINLSTLSGNINNQILISQVVTMPSNCNNAEFIISIRNTDPNTSNSPDFVGILIDSVSISLNTPNSPPPSTNDTLSVYDIQFTTDPNGVSNYISQQVVTGGIVTAVSSNSSFFISSGSGPWSGIYVYTTNNYNINVGDSVIINATVDEYNTLTELVSVTNLQVVSSGNNYAVYNCSTGAANSEEFEGCMVQVTNATCNNDNAGFGEWIINDGTGDLAVDDLLFSFTPTMSFSYNVRGPMTYSWGAYKILPRDSSDINQGTAPPPPTIDTLSLYDIQFTTDPNGISYYISQQVITGGIVTAVRSDNSFFITSGSGPWSGIYVHTNNYGVNIGDSVIINAEVNEYYDLTELVSVTNVQVVSNGNSFAVNNCSTGAANSEEFEGCMVQVTNATCNNDNAGFGEWIINDGTGDLAVDDLLFSFTPIMSYLYDVKGPITFSFGAYKLLPRQALDINQSVGLLDGENFVLDIYPNPANKIINITSAKKAEVSFYDTKGSIFKSVVIGKGLNTIDLNEFSSGTYFLNVEGKTLPIIIK